MSENQPAPRAEHPSLTGYLRTTLSDAERAHVGLLSFNQWTFTLAALADTALAANELGSGLTVGFWADDTPLEDPGWTTSRTIARLLRSPTKDQRAQAGLRAAGIPTGAFARPPIRRWRPHGLPATPTPLTRSAIRALTYDGSGMGRSILQVHPDFNTPIRDDYVWPRRWIEAAMRSYAWVYDQTTELIRQRSLTALIVYNGRFTHDQAAAAAAEKAGIQVLYYDAGGLDNGFDLTTATTHDWQHLQQRMLRMWANWPDAESQDRHASQESRGDRESLGRQWFENRQAHKEPGIEVFVGQQKRGHLEGVPDAEQLVVFFSSSGDEIAELDLDWAEYLGSQENALRTLAEVCRSRPGTELVVRTHPHMRLKPEDDLQRWRAAVEAATPSMHIDATSPVDSYALMRAADVVFTYGSTSGVEAAFIGRPVAVMGPSAYDVIGCATRIRSSEDIEKFLVNPPVPQPDEALKYGLMMQRRGFNYEFLAKDALGTIRVGDVALDDPSELVKKLSHAKRAKRTRWLTAS